MSLNSKISTGIRNFLAIALVVMTIMATYVIVDKNVDENLRNYKFDQANQTLEIPQGDQVRYVSLKSKTLTDSQLELFLIFVGALIVVTLLIRFPRPGNIDEDIINNSVFQYLQYKDLAPGEYKTLLYDPGSKSVVVQNSSGVNFLITVYDILRMKYQAIELSNETLRKAEDTFSQLYSFKLTKLNKKQEGIASVGMEIEIIPKTPTL